MKLKRKLFLLLITVFIVITVYEKITDKLMTDNQADLDGSTMKLRNLDSKENDKKDGLSSLELIYEKIGE